MKRLSFLILVLLLSACSKEENAATPAPANNATIPAPTVENAQATLEAAKQVEQINLDAAKQQQQTIEQTENR